MQKDIHIPEVKDIYVAAVHERNEDFGTMEWNAYLINDGEKSIETVLIVSRGYDESQSTSVMRHTLKKLPPKSFAKIEFIQDEVLELNNEFSVSYFLGNNMFHKKFFFGKNSINVTALREIPVMDKKGVLAS